MLCTMKSAPILLAALLVVATLGVGGFAPAASGDNPDRVGDDGKSVDSDVYLGLEGEQRLSTTDYSADPVVVTAQLETESSHNETRVLGISDGDVSRSEIRREHADIGPTLGTGVNATGAELKTAAIKRQLESTESPEDRQRQILAELSEIEQFEVTLNQKERAAVTAYSAGEIDAREFGIRLASIRMEAQLLRDRLDVIATQAADTPDFSVGARINNLDFQLQTYDGPVRSHVSDVLGGEEPPVRIFVESGGNAVVLSMVQDREYVREAMVPDRQDRSTTGTIDIEDAENITFSSYPEIAATRTGSDAVGSDGLFIVQVPHDSGELTAFVDGGSEQVFKEYQRLDAGSTAGPVRVGDVQEGLNVTVDKSYPGGPVQVTVLDAEEGTPVVGATVTVGDAQESHVVGETDTNGQHWIVSSRSTFLLTILADQTTVARLQIDPSPTPHLEPAETTNGSD